MVSEGDKVVLVECADGNTIALRCAHLSIGDKVVVMADSGGNKIVVPGGSASVGDKVIIITDSGGQKIAVPLKAGKVEPTDLRMYVHNAGKWYDGSSTDTAYYSTGLRHGGDETYELEDAHIFPRDIAFEIKYLNSSRIELWIDRINPSYYSQSIYYKDIFLVKSNSNSPIATLYHNIFSL